MEKIVQNSFLGFLFFCLMQIISVQAEETKSLIGRVKPQSLFRRLIVSLVERMALKEYHAFLPTKTSRVLPVATFLFAFVPLFLKIFLLKKDILLLTNKYNKKKKKYDDIVVLGNEKDKIKQDDLREIYDALREIYGEEKRVFEQQLESGFKQKESMLKDEIKDLKTLIDALSKQAIKHTQQNETDSCNNVIEKKHNKIQKRIDTENKEKDEERVSQKRFVHVEDMNKQGDDDNTALYKYAYLEKSPEICYVFSVSAKNSCEYNAYKNYLFVLDQATRDAIVNKIEASENKIYRALRHHAKSCISKIKPQDGELCTIIYTTILNSDKKVEINDIINCLPEQNKHFDFVGFFGHTIMPDDMLSVINNFDEREKTILCLAGINHESRKWIKKNEVERFKICLNIRKDDRAKLLKNEAINVTLKSFFEKHDGDTIATMSFEYPVLFLHKTENLSLYHNYRYVYTKKHGHLCYNIDIKQSEHSMAKSIADNIKQFSKNSVTFFDTKLHMTLLTNTLMMHNLSHYRKEKFDDEHKEYKSAIPKEEKLMTMNHHVKALIKHKNNPLLTNN